MTDRYGHNQDLLKIRLDNVKAKINLLKFLCHFYYVTATENIQFLHLYNATAPENTQSDVLKDITDAYTALFREYKLAKLCFTDAADDDDAEIVQVTNDARDAFAAAQLIFGASTVPDHHPDDVADLLSRQ